MKSNLPEIWGGIECTINRLHDRYIDQLHLAGLYDNPSYVNAIIDLGIKCIRFPVLWEKHQPILSKEIDWWWTEKNLNVLNLNNITPIAGLLHHGSGPFFTNLLDDNFPMFFASYAAKVAGKFPWLQYYTPVNEPLTTARFSGLYGLWYPHKKNDASFIKMLLNELKASVLAMREIRKINPAAKFVQTEDLGKTYSTPLLSYQANFENSRRWLTYDILCGNVTEKHPLWEYLIHLGIHKKSLEFFIDNPCVPDIIGVNHYLTSERFLDDNIKQYPNELIGGNNLHRYADIEAVRVPVDEPYGLAHLLKELWERYEIPIAITEAHLSCTREEQLRWLHQVYETACALKKSGVDIVAVTSWALFGSFGWNKLLTGYPLHYETGAFDISGGNSRPTALAGLVKKIARQQSIDMPGIRQSGWWQLNTRYYNDNNNTEEQKWEPDRPVIIIGGSGKLEKAFSIICRERNIRHRLLGKNGYEICDEEKFEAMILRFHPWAIINTDGCEEIEESKVDNVSSCKEHYTGGEQLALLCRKHHIKLLSFSTDPASQRKKDLFYAESALTHPFNIDCRHQQLSIKRLNPNALVVTTSVLFSPWDDYDFIQKLLTKLTLGNSLAISNDKVISPTYVPHLVQASLDLMIDNASGIWHLTNKDCLTWYQFARKIVNYTRLDGTLLIKGDGRRMPVLQPVVSALESKKYHLMPSLDDALSNYFSLIQPKKIITCENIANERI